jgi:hypothetical protein
LRKLINYSYANDIAVFGHRRGDVGVSIWDIKSQIGIPYNTRFIFFILPLLYLFYLILFFSGLTSPEIHTFFREPKLTARQVARSAYFMSFFNLHSALSDEQVISGWKME